LRLERFAALAGIAIIATAFLGCDRSPTHASLEALELPRLVPAREFVFNVDRHSGFSFSPDGTRIAWTGPSGWRSALHVRSEVTGKTHVYRVGGSGRHWSADGRRMLILDDKSGAENHHLYRLDIDDPDAKPVNLTPFPGVRVWLHRILKADPDHVLVLHNRRGHTIRDLYRINLSTGAEEVVALNPGDGIVPITDEQGQFVDWRRIAPNERARGKPLPPHLKERSSLARKSPEVTQPVGVSEDRKQAWVLSNRGRDRVGLFHLQADQASAATVLHEDSRVDIGQVRVSDVDRRPLLAASVPDYPHTKVFDERLAADLKALLAPYGESRYGFDLVSSSPDETRLVVLVYTHANRRYFLLDRTNGRSTLLGESRSVKFQSDMVVPKPVEYEASDGLRIPAYLLQPPGTKGRKLPLVLLVHGGPWARVAWTDLDDSEDLLRAQFLANRGYAVLVVNYRGSTGYGRTHMTAAVGQFGKAMQQDLIDGVRWAVDAGIADPQRIAVVGYSYGGYATLMALAQQPKMFACGVDIAGPTDLARLIETFPPYWELELSYWYSYVGDPAVASDRMRMAAVSPINLVQKIEKPLLVIQGATDVRVPPEQSRTLVARLQENGRSVEYVELPEMGHSMGYWAHHLAALRRIETFLAPCLGGRSARFDALEWAARLSGRLPLW
jgi:dipeptidyl aminopeptidase/acylaminoacyl peptidase